MATTKVLKPTNETITIPAMSETPDATNILDALDKEGDAINALDDHIVKYGDVSYGPVSVSADSIINIANPYASNNCLGVILKSGGGSGGYAKGFVTLAGNNIRFVPAWTDSNVSMVFTVLYTP